MGPCTQCSVYRMTDSAENMTFPQYMLKEHDIIIIAGSFRGQLIEVKQ